jgi:hypothetical protein
LKINWKSFFILIIVKNTTWENALTAVHFPSIDFSRLLQVNLIKWRRDFFPRFHDKLKVTGKQTTFV